MVSFHVLPLFNKLIWENIIFFLKAFFLHLCFVHCDIHFYVRQDENGIFADFFKGNLMFSLKIRHSD